MESKVESRYISQANVNKWYETLNNRNSETDELWTESINSLFDQGRDENSVITYSVFGIIDESGEELISITEIIHSFINNLYKLYDSYATWRKSDVEIVAKTAKEFIDANASEILNKLIEHKVNIKLIGAIAHISKSDVLIATFSLIEQ